MPDGSTSALQGGRPSIEIDGQRDSTLSASLLRLDICDGVESMARCELLFGNWGGAGSSGFQHFDRRKIEFGKSFAVKLSGETLFQGRVSAILALYPEGGPPQIGVCLEDRLQDLRMTRRTRVFVDTSLVKLIRDISADHGLTADATGQGPDYPMLAQINQSDLAFLRDVARREGTEVWVADRVLKAATRGNRNAGRVALSWAGTLRSFNVLADLAHQRTSLVASGWDPTAKEAVKHEAGESAIQAEVSAGESGRALLQRAFGDRPETLAHALPAGQSEARAYAEAGLRHAARRFVSGEGVAETSAGLRVAAEVALTGLGPLFDGVYVLTALHHRFDTTEGLRTEFRCERCWLGRGG